MSNSCSEPFSACSYVWWLQGPSRKGRKSKLMAVCSMRPSVPSCEKGSEMEIRVEEGAGPAVAGLNCTEI